MSPQPADRWLPLVAVVALWVPPMIAASYEWGNGEYYDYGWFVAPVALLLLVRRWRDDPAPVKPLTLRWPAVVLFLLLVLWFTLLRILGHTDPSWRLPMGLAGLTAALVGHGLIAASRGLRSSIACLWITLLLLSALPWPSVVEARIVHGLTDGVVAVVAELFQLAGKPVEVLGDRLVLHDLTVEVTDGCSGVRSFQSFVMASWFFAELHRLRAGRAVALLACGMVVAFVVNAGRTFALAQIRFTRGEAAFDQAHDMLGILAFALSALLFYLISGWLAEAPRRKLVKTVQDQAYSDSRSTSIHDDLP